MSSEESLAMFDSDQPKASELCHKYTRGSTQVEAHLTTQVMVLHRSS